MIFEIIIKRADYRDGVVLVKRKVMFNTIKTEIETAEDIIEQLSSYLRTYNSIFEQRRAKWTKK